MPTPSNKIIEENTAQQEPKCNHFMVWNVQGGYSYYRCDNCNYIDGKKTFEQALLRQKQGLKKIIKEAEARNPDSNGRYNACREILIDLEKL